MKPMTTDKPDLVEPATNEEMAEWRKEWEQRVRRHNGWGYPKTAASGERIGLSLIARVEAAEARARILSLTAENLEAIEANLKADLAAATKLIEAQHEVLRAYGRIDALATALAAHDDWKKGDTES